MVYIKVTSVRFATQAVMFAEIFALVQVLFLNLWNLNKDADVLIFSMCVKPFTAQDTTLCL